MTFARNRKSDILTLTPFYLPRRLFFPVVHHLVLWAFSACAVLLFRWWWWWWWIWWWRPGTVVPYMYRYIYNLFIILYILHGFLKVIVFLRERNTPRAESFFRVKPWSQTPHSMNSSKSMESLWSLSNLANIFDMFSSELSMRRSVRSCLISFRSKSPERSASYRMKSAFDRLW